MTWPRIVRRGDWEFVIWPPGPDGRQLVWSLGPSTRETAKLGSTSDEIGATPAEKGR